MDASQIFDGLSEPEGLPVEAIRAAQADRQSMIPVFLRSFEEFSSRDSTSIHPSALFFAFHLLGEWRERSAYRPLSKFLRLPSDTINRSWAGPPLRRLTESWPRCSTAILARSMRSFAIKTLTNTSALGCSKRLPC